jgi:hypothetical protein
MTYLSKKTIQKSIDFYISEYSDWVNVDYRGSNWELSCEMYPEDDTANFIFTNSKKTFVIATDPVFDADDELVSAPVIEIIKLYDN